MSSSTQSRWIPCPIHASQNQPCRECAADDRSAEEIIAEIIAWHTVYPRIGGQMCHGCDWQSWEDGGSHGDHVAKLVMHVAAREVAAAELRGAKTFAHQIAVDLPWTYNQQSGLPDHSERLAAWVVRRAEELATRRAADEHTKTGSAAPASEDSR